MMYGDPAARTGDAERFVLRLGPTGDRDRVGLIGQQVGDTHAGRPALLGQERRHRGGVEEHAQVDGPSGQRGDQPAAPVGQNVGRCQLRCTGEHDGGQPDGGSRAEAVGRWRGPGHEAEGDHADEHGRHRHRAGPEVCAAHRRMMAAAARSGEPGSLRSGAVLADELRTPALLVDGDAFARNVATMSAALPGPRLRPHVKAFKSTALARELATAGHRHLCGATLRELAGLAAAGLGDDLLLANETVDEAHLREVVDGGGRITVAVDSPETIEVAARAGVRRGAGRRGRRDAALRLPPEDAGGLADAAHAARARGPRGHGLRGPPHDRRSGHEGRAGGGVDGAAHGAHADVGGEVVSGGGTGTYAVNQACTEIQAGSYAAHGHQLRRHRRPVRAGAAAAHHGRLGATARAAGRSLDGGLKALGMDHGNPSVDGGEVWFCSDEHTTFAPADGAAPAGRRPRDVVPAHVDPTVAYHERFHVVAGDEVVDIWPVDLRGW